MLGPTILRVVGQQYCVHFHGPISSSKSVKNAYLSFESSLYALWIHPSSLVILKETHTYISLSLKYLYNNINRKSHVQFTT